MGFVWGRFWTSGLMFSGKVRWAFWELGTGWLVSGGSVWTVFWGESCCSGKVSGMMGSWTWSILEGSGTSEVISGGSIVTEEGVFRGCSGSALGSVLVDIVEVLFLVESRREIPLISSPCASLTGESRLRSVGGRVGVFGRVGVEVGGFNRLRIADSAYEWMMAEPCFESVALLPVTLLIQTLERRSALGILELGKGM